jgi:succinate dehydrogenase / fumarate reductase cytochrome b subunit
MVEVSSPGAKAPRGPADRPLSPHMQVWRWHVTMATSILHRASLISMYVGALILAGFFIALAAGPDAFEGYKGLLGSPIGMLVLFGLTVALTYHLLYTIRQTFWDSGIGFEVRTSDLTSWLCIIGSVVLALLAWALAFLMGAL